MVVNCLRPNEWNSTVSGRICWSCYLLIYMCRSLFFPLVSMRHHGRSESVDKCSLSWAPVCRRAGLHRLIPHIFLHRQDFIYNKGIIYGNLKSLTTLQPGSDSLILQHDRPRLLELWDQGWSLAEHHSGERGSGLPYFISYLVNTNEGLNKSFPSDGSAAAAWQSNVWCHPSSFSFLSLDSTLLILCDSVCFGVFFLTN